MMKCGLCLTPNFILNTYAQGLDNDKVDIQMHVQ